MASLFDPFGLVPRAAAVAKTGFKVAGWAEETTMAFLRARLESSGSSPAELEAPKPAAAPLDEKMRRLLDRALDQSTGEGRSELYHRLLDQLIPDEARILSALSDDEAAPLVTVRARTAAGGPGTMVLANASLVGRTANLALPHMTPSYITHLQALGLVETGREDPKLKEDYEILLAESYVLKALKTATRGPLPPRVEKRTVRITELGRNLWQAST